jgi:phosphoglycolate phosphatase
VTSHLFLDLDGTLTDPREGIVRCIAHALATLKRPMPVDHALERFIGPPLARTFETLLGTTDDVLIRAAVEAYRDRFGSIGIFENRVYPEIPSALAVLTDRGFTLHLVTSKPGVFARRILDHFRLSTYFAGIHGPELDDMNQAKATLVGRALSTEHLAPDAAVMIGDRREDIEGARANGVRSIGVTWGYGSREELEAAGADLIVSSVPELLSSVGEGR